MKEKKHNKNFGRTVRLATDRAYAAVERSAIGRAFTAYERTNHALSETAVAKKWQERYVRNTNPGALRRGVAQAMDHSVLRMAYRHVLSYLAKLSMRTIGMFLLTLGAYYGIVHWLVCALWQGGRPDAFVLFGALAVITLGVMLACSNASIGHALSCSVLTEWMLRVVLGFSEDKLSNMPQEGRHTLVVAVPLGMLVGALAALVGPATIGLSLFLAVLALTVFTMPESGIVMLILLTPFSGFIPNNTFWLVIAVALVLAGYICRIMRGTRTFRLEIQDLAVLALLLFTLLLGVSAGEHATKSVVASALLIALYFPAVNMLATPRWLSRCRWMLIATATGASLFAILQFVLALAYATQGAPTISLEAIALSVRAGFADNVTFAYFTAIAFPFALYAFVRERTRHRILSGLACVSIATAGALTFVRSAWIALAVEILVLCLIHTKRIVAYLLAALAVTPGIIALLPYTWRRALAHVMIEQSDLSFARVHTAGEFLSRVYFERGEGFFGLGRGILRLAFGLGRGGVEAVCVLYSTLAPDALTYNFNFWSYMLAEGGLLGVVLPVVVFFLFLQNCLSMIVRAKNIDDHVLAVSGVILVAGIFTLSLFSYAWYDPAALLLLFLSVALITADSRYHRAREIPLEDTENGDTHAELDVPLIAPPPSRKGNNLNRMEWKGGRR